MNGEFCAGDFCAWRQVPKQSWVEVRGGQSIDNLTARLAVEMHMLVQVCTIAGLATLKMHLLDKPGRSEVL